MFLSLHLRNNPPLLLLLLLPLFLVRPDDEPCARMRPLGSEVAWMSPPLHGKKNFAWQCPRKPSVSLRALLAAWLPISGACLDRHAERG